MNGSLDTDLTTTNDAEHLYAAIVKRLHDNKLANLLDAAERLQVIDPDRERAAITYGLIFLCSGKFSESAQVFQNVLREFGESGSALTNLAKAYNGMGEPELALSTLKRSLCVDPNQTAGLMWYAKLHHAQAGTDGMTSAFREIAEQPNSWRSLLWLARTRLAQGQLPEAIDLYKRALRIGYDSDALLMISGDLGKYHYGSHAIALIQPLYDPRSDNVHIGINLLQSLLELKLPKEGKELLEKIRLHAPKEMLPQLSWYAEEFSRLQF